MGVLIIRSYYFYHKIDYKPFGFSALHVACQDGFGDIIKILIQKGANKEIQVCAFLYIG